MMDPKLASTKKSGQALGWPPQKLIPQLSGPVVKLSKAGVPRQTYLKGERDRFGALHSRKVKIQSLTKAY
jgi:hypothetical protein